MIGTCYFCLCKANLELEREMTCMHLWIFIFITLLKIIEKINK